MWVYRISACGLIQKSQIVKNYADPDEIESESSLVRGLETAAFLVSIAENIGKIALSLLKAFGSISSDNEIKLRMVFVFSDIIEDLLGLIVYDSLQYIGR